MHNSRMILSLIHSASPLISILTHIATTLETLPSIKFLYTTRPDPDATSYSSILFLDRLRKAFMFLDPIQSLLELYLTSPSPLRDTTFLDPTQPKLESHLTSISLLRVDRSKNENMRKHSRRISYDDLHSALGPPEERSGVIAYVCGPPQMTDEIVGVLKASEGMSKERVLCEKWW